MNDTGLKAVKARIFYYIAPNVEVTGPKLTAVTPSRGGLTSKARKEHGVAA